MCGSKGFTLLELVVAIAVVGVGFSVVFDLLSQIRLEYAQAESLQKDLIKLNNALVEGGHEGLEVRKRTLEDYPSVEEVSYRLGSAEIFVYQLKR